MGSKRRYVKVNEEKEDTEEKEENSIKWVLFNFMNNKAKTYMNSIASEAYTQDRFGRPFGRCTLILTRPSKNMLKKTDISKIY